MIRNRKGFTLLEILVAVAIMAIGFLAMSQMQYLSLRQKTMAETGTFATNIVETVSDFQMADAKRISALNSRVYLDSQASLLIPNQTDYCDGTNDAVCEQCPCNPMQVFVSDAYDLTTNGNEITCAPVDLENFDPSQMQFFTQYSQCNSVPDTTPSFYIFRSVNTNFDTATTPNLLSMDITYVIKTTKQAEHPDNLNKMGTSGAIQNLRFIGSEAVQNIQLTGHVERDWTNFIALTGGTWNEVFIPHIP